MKLETAFEKFLLEHQLCQKDQRILLAVSAGVDSIVMTDLFIRTGYSVAIAHANFDLRGKESKADQTLVESLAQAHGITCHVTKFKTKDTAREKKLSTQMAARELRYQWFDQLCQEFNYDYVATAHHFDDVIETVYFNLTKGTGIAGLHGIAPKKGRLIRPMLFTNKEAICGYAKQHSLQWREDTSNASIEYARNKLRLQVIPLLREINPNLEQTMRQTVEKLKEVENIFQEKVKAAKEVYVSQKGPDVFISKQILRDEASITVLEILRPFGFNYQQVKQLQGIDHPSGKVYLSSLYQLNVDRSELVISKLVKSEDRRFIFADQKSLALDYFDLTWEEAPCENIEIPSSKMEAMLDFDQLTFPLIVRPWQSGDRLYPLGMSNTKKVSDLLTDLKIPVNLKQRVHVLLSEGLVAWVIGHRIDDRFKITEATNRVLRIICSPH
ncbi:MAG: tRNA lysidine(34) synthetase TilS [Cyclobacteriaceae bacterium]